MLQREENLAHQKLTACSQWSPSSLALIVWWLSLISAQAQDARRDGDWLITRDEATGVYVSTMELTIFPHGEPQPALKYRLIPDEFNRRDGNAAIHYLQAMGFLEQSVARQNLDRVYRQARERAQEAGSELSEVPPYVWLTMPIAELPVDEVREYLNLTAFQRPMLAKAALETRFELDRHIREAQDPAGYLLPEIQSMRELARKQSLRCRLAIAEGNAEEAITILGQQLAMANHLSQDEILVSALVGAAVVGIASDDALQLIQLKDAPNLYWALAALPDPLIDMSEAYAFERQFLLEQLELLREVDETPRPAGFWRDFVKRLQSQINNSGLDSKIRPSWLRQRVTAEGQLEYAALVASIAAAHPGAKRYLIEESGMERERVEAYPTAQVVFLALVKFYQVAADELLKWNHVPVWQARQFEQYTQFDSWLDSRIDQLGWAGLPVELFLPPVYAARTAQFRAEQMIRLLQTVEAIRLYANENAGKLPDRLEDLPVPIPQDPLTGKSFPYERLEQKALLTAPRQRSIEYRLILEMASEK